MFKHLKMATFLHFQSLQNQEKCYEIKTKKPTQFTGKTSYPANFLVLIHLHTFSSGILVLFLHIYILSIKVLVT